MNQGNVRIERMLRELDALDWRLLEDLFSAAEDLMRRAPARAPSAPFPADGVETAE
jgi:hypothetical protein